MLTPKRVRPHAWRRSGVSVVASFAIAGLTAASAPSATARIWHSGRAPIRVLVLYDMEGASGVLNGSRMDPALPDSFAVGRYSLVDDVNNVVAGLYDGGASSVDVQNTHGEMSDTLVPRSRLDNRAGMLAGAQRLGPYVLGPGALDPDYRRALPPVPYDAVVTVAMHDKPMSRGFSPHTIGAGISPIMDGRAMTETELVGYGFGMVGIPVIFSSGDDKLRATLANAMPWVEYAVVKRIPNPPEAESLPRDQVRRDLRAAASRAVRRLATANDARVMRLNPPFRAGLLPSYPRSLPPGISNLPGIERRGDTVTFTAQNYRDAYWGMWVLQRISAALMTERFMDELGRDPVGKIALKRAMDSVWARSEAFEAGKWSPR